MCTPWIEITTVMMLIVVSNTKSKFYVVNLLYSGFFLILTHHTYQMTNYITRFKPDITSKYTVNTVISVAA